MTRQTTIWVLSLVVCVLFTGSVGAQQFYKWVDASGATHYSDHPPEKGKSTTVAVKGPDNSVPPPQMMSETPSAAKVLDDAETASRRRSCLTAQNNLKILQGEGAAMDSSDISTANALTAQRRIAAKEQAMKDIDTNCGPKP